MSNTKFVCEQSPSLLLLFAEFKYLTMPDVLCLRRSQPQEWLLGENKVPNPVTATLRGEDGQVSGVPVAFLAADSSFVKTIFLDCDEKVKQITLIGVEVDTISSYVSLLCTGWLRMGDSR